jgi:hypothetical protein
LCGLVEHIDGWNSGIDGITCWRFGGNRVGLGGRETALFITL